MSCKPLFLSTAAALVAVTASPSFAVTAFSDDFEDGNRNGWFNIEDTTNPENLTLSVESADPRLGSAHELKGIVGDTESLMQMMTHFNGVTLSNPGDFISLSFDTYHLGTGFDSSSLRVGIYNSRGTPVTADTGGLTDAIRDDDGYYFTADMGGSTSNVSADMRGPDIDYDGSATWAGGNDYVIAEADTPDDPLMWSALEVMTYTFTLTLNDQGTYVALLQNDETDATTELSGITPGHPSDLDPILTFDTLYFSSRQSLLDYRIDNVTVTTNGVIPEPASLMLASAGGLLLLARRRR